MTNLTHHPQLAITILVAAIGMAGCGMQSAYLAPPPVPLLPPQGVTAAPTFESADGSLWVHGRSESLWSDPTARQLYDIVRIDVVEDTSARQTAETDLERESSLDFGIPNLLGRENEWDTINDDDPDTGVDPTHLVRANSRNDFEGEAETLRRSTLVAEISAQVVEVFPNGNMRLYGSQVVALNNENQLLTVEGIARPIDIRANNSISSNLLAELRIDYTGRGVVSDLQRPGWGSRILNWVWPF